LINALVRFVVGLVLWIAYSTLLVYVIKYYRQMVKGDVLFLLGSTYILKTMRLSANLVYYIYDDENV
jgi:uncharacterized membrane protein